MKAAALGKSWDDVFPDHSTELLVPRKHDPYDIDEVSTKHLQHGSVHEEEANSTTWDISPRAFHQLKESLKHLRKSIDSKKAHSKDGRRIALEHDVAHLKMKLQSERSVRYILEQALGRATSAIYPAQVTFASQNSLFGSQSTVTNTFDKGTFPSKETQKLIKEIALLELEVAHLEQHLLSLYRKAFEQQLQELACEASLMDSCESSTTRVQMGCKLQQRDGVNVLQKQILSDNQNWNICSVLGSRNRSSARQSLTELKATKVKSMRSPLKKDRELLSSYPNPMSWHKNKCRQRDQTDHLKSILDQFVGEQGFENPNQLSEELVRCMAGIYCKLAEPPLMHLGDFRSPSSSSARTCSPRELPSDGWSPSCRTDASCDISLCDSFQVKRSSDDAFQEKGVTESKGACKSMVEVPWICIDNDRVAYAARMLHSFRSLVQQLENIDPGQMKHEEKLAFWINIYNSLTMHAYLAYGIPRTHVKRATLLQKAAYKIGSHSISAHTIQQFILGCRALWPAQWLQTLLSPRAKFRGGECQAYALDNPEPLVCFALCCGGRSDPPVRVYTASNIYEELEVAKREFLQANVGIRRESRVLLPRILEAFSRETFVAAVAAASSSSSSSSSSELLEWICENVPPTQQTAIKKCISQCKPHKKCIEWVPYNFVFRYVFVLDLATCPPTPSVPSQEEATFISI